MTDYSKMTSAYLSGLRTVRLNRRLIELEAANRFLETERFRGTL